MGRLLRAGFICRGPFAYLMCAFRNSLLSCSVKRELVFLMISSFIDVSVVIIVSKCLIRYFCLNLFSVYNLQHFFRTKTSFLSFSLQSYIKQAGCTYSTAFSFFLFFGQCQCKKKLLNVLSLPTEFYEIASRAGTAVFNELSTLKTWRILTSCLTNGA